jgi:hypothetical protein
MFSAEMGEAKNKLTRTDKFILDHPYCCYCGGSTPATTLDHVPSRQTFLLKYRPQGLEVPACKKCQGITKGHELVTALVTRVYPDVGSKAEWEDLKKLCKGIRRNMPLLLDELQPSWLQQYDYRQEKAILPTGVGILNVSGPRVNESMHLVGVKLCLALHYYHLGSIVPKTAGIAVKWYTNQQQLKGAIPQELSSLFTSHHTLKQGRWNVKDQFEYSWAATENRQQSAYFAGFRQSFAIAGFTCHDWTTLPTPPVMEIYAPGFLRWR